MMGRNRRQKKIKNPSDWRKVRERIHKSNRKLLEKSLFEMTAAYRIGREASYIFDLDKCLKFLVDKIADLMSVEIVSIMLMDKYHEGLLIKIAKGLDNEITKQRVKVGQGIAGWIAKTGKPLLIKNIRKDLRFPRRNGKYYTDSLLSVPLKVHNRVIGVINVNNKVSRDVFKEPDLDMLQTVSNMAAAAIESARLQQEAEAKDKVKLDFISNVSHELKAPLSSIKESISLISDEITGSVNQKQRKFLELATQNIDRLSRLIDELLELAKVQSRITLMKRKLFDAVELIDKAIISLAPLGREKKVSLKSKLPEGEIKIWADPDKISQVLTNLIDNAIKYNKPGGSAEVGLEETDKFVKIYVSDTGIGIPKEAFERIFDKFQRIERCIKNEPQGAGIGLSITKDIAERHGGKISVESEIGKGSKFIVSLPKDLRRERRS